MKTVEQLKRLESNPFYTLSDEEKQLLESQKDSGDKEESPKKVSSLGNAAVKEIGKINKHDSDPRAEG